MRTVLVLCSYLLVTLAFFLTNMNQEKPIPPYIGLRTFDPFLPVENGEERRSEYTVGLNGSQLPELEQFRVKWTDKSVGYYDSDTNGHNSMLTDCVGPSRKLGVPGTLVIESGDGRRVPPQILPQRIRIVVARTPDVHPNWSKGYEKDSVWSDCVVQNDGSFLALFAPDRLRRPIGGTGRFQVAACLEFKSGSTKPLKNSISILPQSVGTVLIRGPIRLSRTMQAINGVPSFGTRNWNPVMLVRAVNYLQSLGRAKAIAELQEFRKIARRTFITEREPTDIDTSNYDCVWPILRLLFDVDNRNTKMQIGLMEPSPQAGDESCWPRFPLAVMDDIPFTLIDSVTSFGPARDPMDYLGRGTYLNLRAKPLLPADDPIATVEKLLTLPETGRLCDSEDYRAMLRRQAWQAIAHLVRAPMGDNDCADAAWEERKKLAARLKIHWDVEKQDYVAEQSPAKSNRQ
jgi:hypothetical protein